MEPSDYKIKNPYQTVNWDTWRQYRAQLHAHTLYSDGEMSMTDVVEAYYAHGYDILAVTDHGVVHTGWDRPHRMIPVIGFNRYLKRGLVHPMEEKRCAEISAGADRGGKGMLDVKSGIELNALTMRKNHVNGFFCGWGQNVLGKEEDYETAIAQTEKAGGISFINHPGDFLAAGKDRARIEDWSSLSVFTDPLLKHPSCVGIEVFNCRDVPTRHDRALWDKLLMYCIPRGRNIWAFSNDDSHAPSHIGLTAEMIWMPDLSEGALRKAMENGTFFACSRIAREELGESFVGSGDYAVVRRIDVDEAHGVIAVSAEHCDAIEWISNGIVIASGPRFHLAEHEDDLGCYVRFRIRNAGGLLLSQPFILDDGHLERHLIPAPADARSFAKKLLSKTAALCRKNLLGELIYRACVLEKRFIKL